jgi:hypothetical protein
MRLQTIRGLTLQGDAALSQNDADAIMLIARFCRGVAAISTQLPGGWSYRSVSVSVGAPL